jgi:hypothetical protein
MTAGFSDITALLVGCSIYPETTGLESIPPVANNLRRFCSLLADPAVFGLPDDHIHCLEEPGSTKEFARFVVDKAGAASGTLLFYYAGHGLISDAGALLLPTRDTDRKIVRATSVE